MLFPLLFPLLFSRALAQDPKQDPAEDTDPPEPVEADGAPPPIPEPVDPAVIHEALRALRTELGEALKARNVDALLKTLHPDVVFTTTGGDALRGREGVKQYFEKMLEGPDAVVESFAYDITSDELSILHSDDMAIAWGPSHDHYEFSSGDSIDMDTRWSATLVRSEGRWLIAAGHTSLPAFDNAVLDQAAGYVKKVGIGALIVGLLLGSVGGLLVGRLSSRR